MVFSISEIRSKNYVEMTWRFAEIRSSTYRRNTDVKSMSIQRGVSVWTLLRCLKDVCLIYVPVKTSLQHAKLVSLT